MESLAGIGAWVATKTVPVWLLPILFLAGLAAGIFLANSSTISKLIAVQDEKAAAVVADVKDQHDAGVKDTDNRNKREDGVDKKTETDNKSIDSLPVAPDCKVPASFFKMLNEANK